MRAARFANMGRGARVRKHEAPRWAFIHGSAGHARHGSLVELLRFFLPSGLLLLADKQAHPVFDDLHNLVHALVAGKIASRLL